MIENEVHAEFDLSENQVMIAEMIRDFGQKEIVPYQSPKLPMSVKIICIYQVAIKTDPIVTRPTRIII